MNENMTLEELSRTFFSRKYEYVEPNEPIKGRSGQKWKFDALIGYNGDRYGVFIRNWNRSIGVNQIRQLEKACRDTHLAGGIIVGDIFSSQAEIFGETLGIQVVNRTKLESKMRNGL